MNQLALNNLQYKLGSFILILFIIVAIGCDEADNDKMINSGDVTPGPTTEPTTNMGMVVISEPDDDPTKWGTDKCKLNNATITGDTLTVNVSYSGGCETHEFTLVIPKAFSFESLPVQLPVSLVHNANGDRCKAYLTEDYQFDLSPIKTLFQEFYQGESDAVILLLEDYELTYKFTM